MKIISWNVNGLRSVLQKGLVEFREEQKPDVLCLQETKCHPDQLEKEIKSPPPWTSFWSSARRPGYSGVATFLKETPEQVRYGFGIPKFDAEGRVVMTEVRGVEIYNVYFPNGGAGPERHAYKQEFLRRFGHYLSQRAKDGRALIVLGDYNVAYLDIDVYDPQALSRESGFLPEERRWMTEFLEAGFIDGFRYFHPKEEHRYTWWSYYENARPGNRGWRIDHICVTRNLESKLKRVDIMDEQLGSDHCPVVMEIDL